MWVRQRRLGADGGGGGGRQSKAAGEGLLFFRMGHVLTLRGQEARCFLKAFFLLSNLPADNTQEHSVLTEHKNLCVCRLFIFRLQLITILSNYYPSILCASAPPTTTSRPWRLPPHLKSCQNMMRIWAAFAKKRSTGSWGQCALIRCNGRKKAQVSIKKYTFCPQSCRSAANRIIVNKIKN